MLFRKPLSAVLMLSLCALVVPAHAADDDGVSPYRPSVSTPAQLPKPGQLEFELGGLSAKTGDARRDSLPYQFKLAFNKEWGVLLGGEAYVSARDDSGNRLRGVGDTNVVLKRAFEVDDATAFGLELNVKLPSAKDGIGSGKTDWTGNGIFSKDFGKLHMDTNLNFTRLGAIDPGTGRVQTGWSASFSHPLVDKWGATGELSGTHRNGMQNTAQLLGAVTYNASKTLVLDFGVARGLTGASQDWSFFAGAVFPLAKLW
jgi:hypothetical protein